MRLSPDWLSWPETQTLIKAFSAGELRFVGGCVRDAVLERPVQDVDAATPRMPDEVMAKLTGAHIKVVPTGIDHGTITAVIGKKHFEITTLRKDTSCDGRHAEVAFTDDWKEDARRRDFTMNALYLSSNGELFDYFDGAEDARAGRVRFIGMPEDRIKEDYLRILRFFRFHAWYGKGEPDASALNACAALAQGIEQLSGERIQQEMFKLLAAPQPLPVLQLMQGFILKAILGDTASLDVITNIERIGIFPDAQKEVIRLAALLLGGNVSAAAKRWKLSNDVNKRLAYSIAGSTDIRVGMTPKEQKRTLRYLGKDIFVPSVLLHWAAEREIETHRAYYQSLLALAEQWQIPAFPVTGKDLRALGIPEGKPLGETLARLEKSWEAADYTLTREALLKQI